MLRLKFFFSVAVLACAVQSQQSIERRVADLEKRVAYLESRLAQLSLDPTSAASGPATAPGSIARRQPPFTVSLLEKKNNEIILPSGNAERQFGFMVMFTNGLGKDVHAFTGDLAFRDISGKELISFEMDFNLQIGAGKQASWMGSVDLDGKNPKHRALFDADKSEIIPVLTLKKAVYSDGTQELF